MEENHPRAVSDSALDKLSNLPSLVIDQILCRLPIRDAVRTSVLSSEWRFKCTTMSDLVFGNEHVNVIDEVLLQHIDAISKFKLVRTKSISSTDLDRWILRLSRCHVQELKLKLWQPTPYKLHSMFFSFQDFCHLKLPSTFAGFKKLKKLKLENLYMAQDACETLISSCPILDRLTLNIKGFNRLNIDAPNLLKFGFRGCFYDMNLINCSKLEEVSIELCITGDATERIKTWDSSNLLEFFSSLPCIKYLEIEKDFLKYLAAGDIPRQLPNPCTNLGYLRLETWNYSYAECYVALCLLRSFPNLQELNIKFWKSPEGNEFTFWESKRTNCSFNKLQTVTIYVDAVNKNNLELIGFILLASPGLQKMTIILSCLASEKQELQFARELIRLKRASSNAEVVLR